MYVTFRRFFKIAVARPLHSNGHRLPSVPSLSFLLRNVTPYFIRGGNPANPVNVIRRRSPVPWSPDPSRFQNRQEAMRVDMSRPRDLHRLIRRFLDYELPEIEEFRHARQQFKADLPRSAGEVRTHLRNSRRVGSLRGAETPILIAKSVDRQYLVS